MPELLRALGSFVLVWAYLGSAPEPARSSSPVLRAQGGLVTLGAGEFESTYRAEAGERTLAVASFQLDRTPITNAEFLVFVRENPKYRRDRISPLFADAGYLSHWASSVELGGGAPARAPVVNVSWFSAKAYCEARGARLPSELEWEYAAAASESSRDARRESAFQAQILSWYSRPNQAVLADVGSSAANAWGVQDLHGLVWEWVSDFNATLISSDSRSPRSAERQMFCGAGATSAREVSDYAAFMRIALLSSLSARDSTQNLGFRCARSVTEGS
jgi:formylglycine-generating enzyme required for sulfatase activity